MDDGGDGGDRGVLERATAAAGRGAWREAFDLFVEADAAGQVGLADLPLFGNVAYAAGHLDSTIELWERAYVGLSAAGETVPAAGAAVQVAMHLLFDTALMAPVRGWLARAEQLLDDGGQTPAHAWAAVVRSYERLLIGDRERALQCARHGSAIGARCDPAAAAVGRVAEARILILDGDVASGLALLDEAGVAATSGHLDALSTGVVYCELVCALQGLAQYDLAQEWTEAMERWSATNAIGSLHGRCRVHRAEILRLRGSFHEAEVQAVLACDELRPYLRRELGWPLTELGRIRLCRGDVDGAEEAFVAAHHGGWDPQPGLARVRLAQGDVDTAATLIRDALDSPSLVPSKELPPSSDLRRAPLLDAQVEIAVAHGDLDRARAAADEIERVATRFESRALVACAAAARARVRLAEGDAGEAARLFSDAARAWGAMRAPYEEAIARLGLADAQRALGREHQAALEEAAAQAALDRIGREPVAAAAAVAGALAADRRDPAAGPASATRNAFRREGDHWFVAFDGRTARVRDLKGMHHLARLLADPGRELHVLDLATSGSTGSAVAGRGPARGALGHAGEMLDARAKDAYRRRLAEIDEDLEEARRAADTVREAQADAEREFLVRELSRAVGLGGRGRRAGDASERARSAVTRAIRQALGRIGEHHSELRQHLDRTIRTGTYCCYSPDPRLPPDWDL